MILGKNHLGMLVRILVTVFSGVGSVVDKRVTIQKITSSDPTAFLILNVYLEKSIKRSRQLPYVLHLGLALSLK